ncbi:MAG: hypothetical protein JWR19_1756 [Pedosphaera sp.]|nr:hypothetical protein [Pedosphaera sp.]
MKKNSAFFLCLMLCITASLWASSPDLQAAPAAPVAKDTNAPALELAIPQAVFDVTNSPVKDPFFPLSARQAVVQSNTNAPAFSAASFFLKALSGPINQRLALINNRTVAVGEDAEVTTTSGKIKIHCVDIKDASAVIKAAGQVDPIELHLRKGF